ncbi:50S ribosomal protein L11 methyltransferase [Synoicihabitans lomoniglobus]|uniref:Ribosomal protein L11 methyltransferase n=1 Tax=Synoicihabitans lomoniglobus TaxID=2909285 RepID=A0AAE9ZVQ8_9BACT|nr:50S ribosomal protein L11 methyltransferase [Opitutaceae bacterium LMO-M01]WED63974.1 50S ribosomal protein L11 methyltransferase [Opitutaceae bacterium LMO-M01]
MNLCEIKATLPVDTVDAVDDLLLERGDARWSVMHDVLIPAAWLIGMFESRPDAEAAWTDLASELTGAGEPEFRNLGDEDWRNSYKLHFKPWQCGRLHWVPVWERETYALPAGDVAIWLDPGMAFGTGNHETTRLCCERLVEWAKTAPTEARVIDAGCGSGILAISAARLGFSDIRGFDNDVEAVRISDENAALNDLTGVIRFYEGDLVSGFSGEPGDLIFANILGHVLMQFVPELVTAVAPGGLLVLSGILAYELDQVRDAFTSAVPTWEVQTRIMGEWADVALRRV